MKIELIKDNEEVEMYGEMSCLTIRNFEKYGERFEGDKIDFWLLLDDFVRKIDSICPNDLDYEDVVF